MNRRELLAVLGAVAASPALAQANPEERLALGRLLHHTPQGPLRALTAAQHTLLSEVADLVIPRTDTPGALDVRVPEFIDLLLADWYDAAERDRMLAGLNEIGLRRQGPSPLAAVLETLDGTRGEPASAEWAFERFKSLIVYGYFTSEAVQRDVLRYNPLPGRFDGCVPL